MEIDSKVDTCNLRKAETLAVDSYFVLWNNKISHASFGTGDQLAAILFRLMLVNLDKNLEN